MRLCLVWRVLCFHHRMIRLVVHYIHDITLSNRTMTQLPDQAEAPTSGLINHDNFGSTPASTTHDYPFSFGGAPFCLPASLAINSADGSANGITLFPSCVALAPPGSSTSTTLCSPFPWCCNPQRLLGQCHCTTPALLHLEPVKSAYPVSQTSVGCGAVLTSTYACPICCQLAFQPGSPKLPLRLIASTSIFHCEEDSDDRTAVLSRMVAFTRVRPCDPV